MNRINRLSTRFLDVMKEKIKSIKILKEKMHEANTLLFIFKTGNKSQIYANTKGKVCANELAFLLVLVI